MSRVIIARSLAEFLRKVALAERRERRDRDRKQVARAERTRRHHDDSVPPGPFVSGGLPTLGKRHR